MFPQKPGPNETVKVKLKSYTFNLDSAETEVIINGKVLKKAIGLKSFEFKTGKAGQNIKVLINSQKLNGDIISKEINLNPGLVSLVYELSNPHRPFGYQGKSTAISNSELDVFAIPNLVDKNGKRYDEKTLIYTWYKNYDIDLAKSGFGKNSYHINRLDAFPRETTISVEVTNLDKTLVAKDSIVFKPKSTEIEFYLLDPSLPFSFKNIANPNINSSNLDTTILAVPYFIDNNDEDAKYTWYINNRVGQTKTSGSD
jgi:hypothetical protein